jgi:hypothetical protein
MSTVNRKSLGATLDALNEAWFQGLALSVSERGAAARWIAGRQGLPGSYGRMFAPTDEEMAEGLRLFTGERIVSLGGARHILGEEACRALILLDVADPDVAGALARASRGMMGRLPSSPDSARGMYCCARCSVALWRHLAVGGLEEANPERWLRAGVNSLKQHRTPDGRWRRFPFYYTVLALTEMDMRAAVEELRYAAPVCERLLKRRRSGDVYAERRRVLAERVLERC